MSGLWLDRLARPWAIREGALRSMIEALRGIGPAATLARAERIGKEDRLLMEIVSIFSAQELGAPTDTGDGGVAVIPIRGPLVQHDDAFASYFGATSTERVAKALRAVLADPAVRAIVFDIDSPGGEVAGTPELAEEIAAARGRKPMLALANPLAASAAYWIAAQADEVWAAPSGEVGSIGVILLHEDITGMAEQAGVKLTLLRTAPRKAEGNPFEPLGEETAARFLADMGVFHQMFLRAVARGRGVPPARVEAEFGQGGTVLAEAARRAGMIDRVGTREEALARALKLKPRAARRAGAAEEWPPEEYAKLITRKIGEAIDDNGMAWILGDEDPAVKRASARQRQRERAARRD